MLVRVIHICAINCCVATHILITSLGFTVNIFAKWTFRVFVLYFTVQYTNQTVLALARALANGRPSAMVDLLVAHHAVDVSDDSDDDDDDDDEDS